MNCNNSKDLVLMCDQPGTMKEAHLREFLQSGKCEFQFHVQKRFKCGNLDENIVTICALSDNIASLLQKTAKVIKASIAAFPQGDNRTKVTTNNIKVTVQLKNGNTDRELSPKTVLKNVFSTKENLLFVAFDEAYVVVFNAPFVRKLKIQPILYTNLEAKPTEVSVCYTEVNKCQFFWERSKDKVDWQLVHRGFTYMVVDGDVGYYLKLKCVPCSDTMTGCPQEAVSLQAVEDLGGLPYCPFEDRHKKTAYNLSDKRLVSYNILSEKYADFEYSSPRALSTEYRKQLIRKELLGYNADIICLQEVDAALYETYYKDIFQKANFSGSFHRKGNRLSEGLACFFNTSRFKKLKSYQIVYAYEIDRPQNKSLLNILKSNKELLTDFKQRSTSLQVTVLMQTIKNQQHVIIVGNTHLFYRPDAKLVRLIQTHVALTHLAQLRKEFRNGSVILSGDFNSVPSSPTYAFLTESRFSKRDALFASTKIQTDFQHNFTFVSACGTPKYTNYTSDFKDCLDYIFIESSKMKVRAVVPFVGEDVLAKFEGLPSETFPSDHLALVVDLQMI